MCPGMKKDQLVLVTGGAGFVGSHTVLELLQAGYSVVVLDNCVNAVLNDPGDKPQAIKVVEKLTDNNTMFHNVNLLDKPALLNVFHQHKVDVVIHFAALKAVGESVTEPLMYYKNNITGTVNLLEVMNETGVKKLVFSSSATVYGNPEYLPIDEEHHTGRSVTNPYGQTKHMCEQIMKDLCVSDKDWRIILLRYFNPVGAHKSGQMGEDPVGIPNNLMPYISQVAVGKRPHLTVFGNDYDTPDGTGVRDYIHVVDLAEGHMATLNKLNNPQFSGWRTYNLGTGHGVSVLDMVNAFSKACGRQLLYKISPRRIGDVATVVASSQRAMEELQWSAKKTLDDMCVDSWRWQSQNPEGFSCKK